MRRIPIDSYESALRFMDSLDISAIKLGLERMQAVLGTLGDPQERLPMVHIAGTNGKGSVTAMLGAILKAAGYRVGAFTSPHLIHVRERIAINGNPILPDEFQYEVHTLKAHLEEQAVPDEDWPTFFEYLNIMAYRYFLRQNVDIALFETGLGGRLDSTNVVRYPNLTVITSIGLDHTGRLGNTLSAIAGEKAGIIKQGCPLVVGPSIPQEGVDVILRQAKMLEAPWSIADSNCLQVLPDSSPTKGLHVQHEPGGRDYWLSLLAPYQKHNLATVLESVRQLREQGFVIEELHIIQGLRQTRWPVRFQYFEREALVLDGSHNADGFLTLQESLRLYFPGQPLYWLLSLRANRSPEMLTDLLQAFPETRGVILTCAEPKDLYHAPNVLKAVVENGLKPDVAVHLMETPEEALSMLQAKIQEAAGQGIVGVVTGSLYTAGAILERLGTQKAVLSLSGLLIDI
ncbi:MAG TPA: folylpolyglutamate synthase/dihydrofolate synthase family protein [Oculatellaceae cyanobacterium]|jgi:dihydrofolate synthase/folylpolyglutamate synthase